MNEVLERPPATEIVEYSPTAAALAQLRARLQNVAYDVSTVKGLDVAKKDRAEVRGLRTALEAKRVELKAPALERSRLIDAEAKALTAELVALEKPIDDQIKAEERRKEIEKAAREQAEREAAAKVQARLDEVRAVVVAMAGKSAGTIACQMNEVALFAPGVEEFGGRAGEAAQVKGQTLAKLEEMRAAAIAHEAEQARMAAEREELAKLRAEQEARDKAERQRIAAEQAAETKRLAAERERIAEEAAAAKAARDEEDRIARAARAAEDQRLARERAELESQQRAARQAEEAKAAAERKAEQDRLDEIARQEREAAAAERRRLDNEAAARRAAEEIAHALDQRIRGAAHEMLHALKSIENDDGSIPDEIWKLRCDAIELATGEPA